MSTRKIIIALLLLAPLAIVVTVYVGLVLDGTLPAPNLAAIAAQVTPFAGGALALAVGLAILIVLGCAILAPILYALRADDGLTIIISLVLTAAAVGTFVVSKTVFDQLLAGIIYLANITLSVVVYAAHRIAPRDSASQTAAQTHWRREPRP